MNTNTKLIRLLRQLSNEEGALDLVRKELEAKKSERLGRLLDFLLHNFDRLGAVTKQQAMDAVDKELSDIAYRKLCSKLTIILEGTLAGWQLQARPSASKRYTAYAYKDWGMDGFFIKAARESMSKNLPNNEIEKHIALFWGNYMIYFHPRINLRLQEGFKDCLEDVYLNAKAVDALISLNYYCISRTNHLGYGKAMPEGLEKSTDLFIQSLPTAVKELLSVKLYILACETFRKLDIESYETYKGMLLENIDTVGSEKIYLFGHLINALNLIKHPKERIIEFFSLYKLAVKHDGIVEDGYLSGSVFNNVVYVACEMKELEWLQKFIDSHTKYLHAPKDSLENIQNLYNCHIAFAMGDFDIVLPLLEHIKYEDHTYGIRKYILELKCFYESEAAREQRSFDTLIRSFRKYLDRKERDKKNSISKRRKQVNLNFIKTLDRLVNYPFNNLSKQDLVNYLQDFEGVIAELKWLLEKINQLK